MVGTLQPPCLSVSNTEWGCHHHRMKPLGWNNQIVSPDWAIGRSSGVLGQNQSFLHYVGWMSGQKTYDLQSTVRFFS
jgi:hypothetical protein